MKKLSPRRAERDIQRIMGWDDRLLVMRDKQGRLIAKIDMPGDDQPPKHLSVNWRGEIRVTR
jgi:hypothetical protein